MPAIFHHHRHLAAALTVTVETRRSAETGPVSTPALWPTLVPRTQFVTSDPTVSLATVLLGSLGIHLQIVILSNHDPSVPRILTVLRTRLVLMRTALTRVLSTTRAPHRPRVPHVPTTQCARVHRDMEVIRTDSATGPSVELTTIVL